MILVYVFSSVSRFIYSQIIGNASCPLKKEIAKSIVMEQNQITLNQIGPQDQCIVSSSYRPGIVCILRLCKLLADL